MPACRSRRVAVALDMAGCPNRCRHCWLGNLDIDGLDAIMRRYERDEAPGLQAMFHVPVSELARAYGRPESRLLYERDDLITRWLRMWCEERWPTFQEAGL